MKLIGELDRFIETFMIEVTNSLARVCNYNSSRQKIGTRDHLQKCLFSICEIRRICEGGKWRKTLPPLPCFIDSFLMIVAVTFWVSHIYLDTLEF